MLDSYEMRVEKKRQAWKIYKNLRKDSIYQTSNMYKKAYSKAKQILIDFHKDYTFKNTDLTMLDIENSINMLIDIEIARGKIEKLTDDNISEFLKSVTIY